MRGYHLLLELPGLPRLQADTIHWRKRAKERKAWHEAVGWACNQRRPPEPLTEARLRLTRYSSMPADPDNLAGSFKPIVDGLVKARVLADDTTQIIGCRPEYRWSKTPQKRGFVTVEVWEGLAEACPTCGAAR